jgi:predicted nucleotidyltransferase
LIGFTQFEQFTDEKTDTTIYEFNKLIQLLINCNPNVIEMLGCREDHYAMIHSIGLDLIANVDMFLSKKVIQSFGGYANSQLRRLENALARDAYPQVEKEKHILNSIKVMNESMHRRHHDLTGVMNLYIDDAIDPELIKEIFIDINVKHYPLRDYQNYMNEIINVIRDYGKMNKRNRKKDDQHLNKHAMHLVRLYLMCFDILEEGKVITYREKDRDFLLAIRNGKYQNEDGTYRKEFYEIINEFEEKLVQLGKRTQLPDEPDMKRIEKFVMEVNEKVVLRSV